MTSIPPNAPPPPPAPPAATQPPQPAPAQTAPQPASPPAADAAPQQPQTPPQTQAQPQAQTPPPAQSAPPQATPPPPPPVQAETIKLPPPLQNIDRPVTLRGDVAQVTDQGTLRIDTPRGTVEVKIPTNLPQALTRPGARLEVTIPAQPAQNISIRSYQPAAQSPSSYTTISADTPDSQTITPQNLLRFLKTSLQNALKTPEGQQPQPYQGLSTPRPLNLGQLVRLIPAATSAATHTALPAAPPSLHTLPAGMTDTLTLPVLKPVTPALTGTLTVMPGTGTRAATMPANTIAQLLQSVVQFGAPATPATGTPTLTGIATPGQISVQTPPASPQNLNAQNLNALISTDALTHHIKLPMVDARITAIMPNITGNAPPTPALATLLHGSPQTPVLIAQITGQTATGLPVITVPASNALTTLPNLAGGNVMTLQFPATPMAQGTWVQMNMLQTPQGNAPAFQMVSHLTNLAAQPLWDTMDELMDTLRANAGGTQQTMALVQNALPKPGSVAFSAPVLILMAAARGGDINSWLGERVTDNLRAMRRTDIITRLGNAMTTAMRQADDATPAGEWRSMHMPMLHDQEIARLNMHYRNFERDGDTAGEPRQKGTRFVLDVSLTRMGDMQVDGLSYGKQLDVTLRSKTTFSPAMRQALRQQYTAALEGIGFAGSLNFTADDTGKNWVVFDTVRP